MYLLGKSRLTLCNVPNVIIMHCIMQIFSNPFLNLRMSVGDEGRNIQIFTMEKGYSADKTLFLHVCAAFHLITMQKFKYQL